MQYTYCPGHGCEFHQTCIAKAISTFKGKQYSNAARALTLGFRTKNFQANQKVKVSKWVFLNFFGLCFSINFAIQKFSDFIIVVRSNNTISQP